MMAFRTLVLSLAVASLDALAHQQGQLNPTEGDNLLSSSSETETTKALSEALLGEDADVSATTPKITTDLTVEAPTPTPTEPTTEETTPSPTTEETPIPTEPESPKTPEEPAPSPAPEETTEPTPPKVEEPTEPTTPKPMCGNGIKEGEEECDSGEDNGPFKDSCRLDCTAARCGDGVKDTGEECDDGPQNSDVGESTCSTACVVVKATPPPEAKCGDGIVQEGEQCDNGADNAAASDKCRPDCQLPKCGDGIVDIDIGEQCDEGKDNGATPTSLCATNCHKPKPEEPASPVTESCGDGILQEGEECDDGAENMNSANKCREDCSKPKCGDGIVDPAADLWEECDDGEANVNLPNKCRTSCKNPTCGDGIVDDGEECDKGALNSETGPECTNACKKFDPSTNPTPPTEPPPTNVVKVCGDGIVDAETKEECDAGDKNADTPDAPCRANCLLPKCGDGIVDSTEECDLGGSNSDDQGTSCRSNCKAPKCGDGIVDSGEVCDAGELNSDEEGSPCPKNCGTKIINQPPPTPENPATPTPETPETPETPQVEVPKPNVTDGQPPKCCAKPQKYQSVLPLSEMKEILHYHNVLRCRVGGENMTALQWSEGLAQNSRTCVLSCPTKRDPADHSNLAFGHHTWTRAMDSWDNEAVAYDAETKKCMLGECDDYTTMTSASFDRIGCARSQGTFCPKGGLDVLVCKYATDADVTNNPDASVMPEGRKDMPTTACAWIAAMDQKPLEIPKVKLPAHPAPSSVDVARPHNCKGHWSPWTECSATCGSGNSQRIYYVDEEARHGGEDCETSDGTSQGKVCNHNPCPGTYRKIEALQAEVKKWKAALNSTSLK